MKMPWEIDGIEEDNPQDNNPLTPAPRLDGNGPTAPADDPVSDQALSALSQSKPDLVEAYRAKMAGSQQALKDAQDKQDMGNYGNVAAKALTDFGNSQKRDVVLRNRFQDMGKAPDIVKADRQAYDPSMVNGITKQGVDRAQQQRTQDSQDFNEEQKLTDLQQKRTDEGVTRDHATKLNDPTSSESSAARDYLKQLIPSVASIPNFDKLTAAQAQQMAPGLLEKYRTDSVAGYHTKDAEIRAKALAGEADDRADRRKTAADAKVKGDQDKAMTTTRQLLESARGNPAVAQAEKDIYAADKAKSLANLYGDPNKLSMPQVRLLAAEIGKIASGGVSSQHELEGITPNSLTGRLSDVASKLTNEPTPANAAAFVKQYQDYANQLSKDAQKVITDKYGRVIEGSKKQLGDDNYKALQDNYVNRFKPAAGPMHGSDLPD